MKVYIGSDHRGYHLKEEILNSLRIKKIRVEDMGAYKFDKDDDYTLYAEKVAVMVKDSPGALGILLCGSGVGVEVVANKFDGIRASIAKNYEQVIAGRRDDDMNVLVIAADFTTYDEAKKIVQGFLKSSFSGLKRHRRRLEEIKNIEANN